MYIPETRSIFLIIYLLAGLWMAALAAWIYRSRTSRGKTLLSILLAAAGIWSFVLAGEAFLEFPTFQFGLAKVGEILAVLITFLWVAFCIEVTDWQHRLRNPLLYSLGGYVVVATLLISIDSSLMHAGVSRLQDPYPMFRFSPGIGWYAAVVISYTGILGGIALLARNYLQHGDRIREVGILAIAGLIPLGTHIVGRFILETSITPLGIALFATVITFSLIRHELLNIQPVAAKKTIQEIKEPLITVDYDQKVVNANPAAKRAFPDLETGRELPAALRSQLEFPTKSEEKATTTVNTSINGSEAIYYTNISAIMPSEKGGEVVGYTIILQDYTEVERYRERLEERNAQLSSFASSVSHDLRNPMAIAKGNAEQILHEADEENIRSRAENIQDATKRINDITNELLVLYREGEKNQSEEFELRNVVEEAWANIDSKEASIEITGEKTVVGSRGQITSVFENLYTNSIEHAGRDTEISVEILEDEVRVTDDGPGIPPGKTEEIFEYGRTFTGSGTGIGLSIVKKIVEGHNWTVSVDEEYTDGARFVFCPQSYVMGTD